MKVIPKLNIKKLNDLLSKFNLKTDNYDNYVIAFTHSTYANEQHTISNERIEYLGDAILGMLTAEYIYNVFTDMPEGKMTKLRATYVCEDANFSYSTKLGLDELLLLGAGEEKTGGRQKKAVIADCFECFLGATYLTFGLEAVKNILEIVVFPHIKKIDAPKFIDYKTKLQELVQSDTQDPLEYVTVKEEGPPNDKTFTRIVKLDGIILGRGIGKSKKNADQEAAKSALEKMVR